MLSSDRNFHVPALEELTAGVEDRSVSSHRQRSHHTKGYEEEMGKELEGPLAPTGDEGSALKCISVVTHTGLFFVHGGLPVGQRC